MVSLKAHFDGKVIVPDEPVDLVPNQKLRITIEAVEQPTPAKPEDRRSFGQPGVLVYIAPDFDDHLGDDFWGFEDDADNKGDDR